MPSVSQCILGCCVTGLLLLAGCTESRPAGTLRGTVKNQGAPIANARILVRNPETGAAAVASIGSDGGYAFEHALDTGEYLVSIEPISELPAAGEPGKRPLPGQVPERDDIPMKYRTPGQNALKTKIAVGENVYDVNLEK